VGIVLQGLIRGTGTGLLGVGLVLIYRSSRIVNFAYGSTGGFAAAVGISLYSGKNVPWFVAVVVALAVGALVGVTVERFVIRRFANSSRLILTVATIGLAQVLGGLQLLVPAALGAPGLVATFATPLSGMQVTIFPVIIDGNDLLLLLTVPAVLGTLTWFLLRTDAGVAVRGIAENSERARLIGIPVDRLSTLVWAIAGLVAAVSVMMAAPNQGLALNVASGPTLLLPALAAAVIAGMEDLQLAFIAGVGLGLLDKLVAWNVSMQSVGSVVFLAVILGALLLRKIRLPKDIADLPTIRQSRLAIVGVLGLAALAAPLVLRSSQLSIMTTAFIAGIIVVSVVMLTGWGGSVSLGQYAIAGTGGLVTANLVNRINADLFVTLLVAAAVGALVALVLGLPSLRLSGLFLAVTTMAFAVAVDSFLLNPVNFPAMMPASITRPYLWNGRFDLGDTKVLYFFCLGMLAISVTLVRGLKLGRPGRVLLAARDNDRAAAAVGVPTTRTRLSAFVFSGMLAGVAGGLVVIQIGGLSAHAFPPDASMLIFSMAVIGGIESLSGALLGVALISLLTYLFPQLQLVITGSGLLIVLMVIPRGLTQVVDRLNLRLQVLLARATGHDKEAKALVDGFLVVPDRRTHDGRPRRAEPQPAFLAAGGPAPAPGMARPDGGPPLVLDCQGLEAGYGSMQVLFGVDLAVRQGELVAILGTNGAGKSTLLRALTGLLTPSGGAVQILGQDSSSLTPEQVAQRGVALMPGGRGIFPQLTVDENLRLGAWLVRQDPERAAAARAWAVETFPVLGQRLDLKAGDLSGGEQQMLSLSMAMAARPQVLLIDELSLGLAPTVVSTLLEQVRRVHAAGTTVVVIEQSVNVALHLAHRAIFLDKGRVNFAAATRDLHARPDVLQAVFMGDLAALESLGAAPSAAASGAGPSGGVRIPTTLGPTAGTLTRRARGSRLETRELVKRYGGIVAVDHVSIVVEPGSIVGIVGHNGAGKTTLFDILSGFNVPNSGRILLNDRDITDEPPHRRAIAGLGRSFQEARLYPALSVADTVMMALDTSLACRGAAASAFRLPLAIDSEAAARRQVDGVLDLLGLRSQHDLLISELSTGTRRIVELACILALEPEVVMLDEPSGGVAQKEAEALGPLLRRIQEHMGCSMIVIEHDMHLMSQLCDEFIAMELGHVITRGRPADVLAHPEVVASYLGTDENVVHRSGDGSLPRGPGTGPGPRPPVGGGGPPRGPGRPGPAGPPRPGMPNGSGRPVAPVKPRPAPPGRGAPSAGRRPAPTPNGRPAPGPNGRPTSGAPAGRPAPPNGRPLAPAQHDGWARTPVDPYGEPPRPPVADDRGWSHLPPPPAAPGYREPTPRPRAPRPPAADPRGWSHLPPPPAAPGYAAPAPAYPFTALPAFGSPPHRPPVNGRPRGWPGANGDGRIRP
jgi:ABC-type branched-subunit amino acid transport system ATPase component/ABC-type branched-subunit amino acid transport system permease subunit